MQHAGDSFVIGEAGFRASLFMRLFASPKACLPLPAPYARVKGIDFSSTLVQVVLVVVIAHTLRVCGSKCPLSL